jgi:ParB-like chromosome segregation protein Spo0J
MNFRIRRYAVEHGSLALLRVALHTLEAQLCDEGRGDDEDAVVARHLCDQVAAFRYLLENLAIEEIDQRIGSARDAIDRAVDDHNKARNRLAAAFGPIEKRLADIEDLLEEVPGPFDQRLCRSISRYRQPVSLLHELERYGQGIGEGSPGDAVMISQLIGKGLARDLARYKAMLPFGELPQNTARHEAAMQVRNGQLGRFIAAVCELENMPERQQLVEEIESGVLAKTRPALASDGCQRGYDIFDQTIGQLPIWQRLQEAELWRRLEPLLQPHREEVVAAGHEGCADFVSLPL